MKLCEFKSFISYGYEKCLARGILQRENYLGIFGIVLGTVN